MEETRRLVKSAAATLIKSLRAIPVIALKNNIVNTLFCILDDTLITEKRLARGPQPAFGRCSSSAVGYPMGSADFKSLEDELIDNVEKDVRYWQQNDAKLRAVKNVSTYQEFSDIVKAAHLRPLSKKEIECKSGPSSSWNNVAHNMQDSKQSSNFVADADIKDNIPSACSPKVQEFIVSFRRLDTAKHRYKYLSLHGAEHVASLFHTEEIPPSVLVELLETLLIFPSNSVPDIVAVTRLLDVITGTKRFELAIEFLSSTELDTLCSLFDKLEESLKSGQQDLAEQGVTEWSLCTLRRKYKV